MSELETLQQLLINAKDKHDPATQREYVWELSVWKARLGTLKAEAENRYNHRVREFLNANNVAEMKAFLYRDKLKDFCMMQVDELNLIDNITKALDTQITTLITLISFAKEELKQNI